MASPTPLRDASATLAPVLTKLTVHGFKPFRSFAVELSEFDVFVGRNNMGKSSLIDSLRLIASESNFRLRRDRVAVPRGSVLAEAETAFIVGKPRIHFSVANVHHEYGAKDAQIIAEFDSGSTIHIVFGLPPENNCYFAVSMRGAFLDHPDAVRRALKKISIGVLPPIASLDENEPLLSADYVRRWSGTYRSPRHFRNLWYHDPEHFQEFRSLLRNTWPGADISRPEAGVNLDTGAVELNMFYEEDRMSREVAWAGHGMQIWLQILSYLAKFGGCATLVFDEPEMSLHSDVQRKLVQVLQEHASQIIVATHSVDIINEVPPEHVVLIDKRQTKGRRLESIRQVQQVVEGLGSLQNVALLSLLRSRFVLFIEGGERRILSGLARAAGFEGPFPNPRTVSIVELEGEANWRRLKDFNWILTNTIGERVSAYVLLDRDYRTSAQVEALCRTLRRAGVGVHVWKMKEIENYLLSPPAIRRSLEREMRKRAFPRPLPEIPETEAILFEAAGRYKEHVRSKLLGQVIEEKRHTPEDPSTTISDFNKAFDENWSSHEYRLATAPGKDVLSDLASWSQSTFAISLSKDGILRCLSRHDIGREVVVTLRNIAERSSKNR